MKLRQSNNCSTISELILITISLFKRLPETNIEENSCLLDGTEAYRFSLVQYTNEENKHPRRTDMNLFK